MKPHRIAQQGIARTFQNVEVFPAMTVQENLLLVSAQLHACRRRAGMLRSAVRPGGARGRPRGVEFAELLRIDHLLDVPVGSLPHGTQKRIELARALAMEPRLIMLDEPVAGMNHDETGEMPRPSRR